MSGTAAVSLLEQHIVAVVGADNVHPGSADRAVDAVVPGLVIAPRSPEEVAGVLRFASEHHLTVVPAGGFTRMSIGRVPPRVDILLDLRNLNSIAYYDPGDLTIGVGAGITVGELDAALRPHGQGLPLDVALPEQATIGGVLASAAHGPLKHAFGGVRDYCVGVQFVTADGLVAKAGGRVVKNVAGYDLMKLMIGSYGTLAVIVGANFKLFPRPRRTQTFVARFHSLPKAIQFRDSVMSSPLRPLALEIISPFAENYLTARLHLGAWNIVVRAGGSEAVLHRYRAELGSAVELTLEGADEAQLWGMVSDFTHTISTRHPLAMATEVTVPPASMLDALVATERSATENNLFCAVVGRAGTGNLIVAFANLSDAPPATTQYCNAIDSLRSALPRDAVAVVTSCPPVAKSHLDPWGPTPTDIDSMRLVKRTMDPNDILNRGRFLI
jgi:glycolate oxidase FAD binding subunit